MNSTKQGTKKKPKEKKQESYNQELYDAEIAWQEYLIESSIAATIAEQDCVEHTLERMRAWG